MQYADRAAYDEDLARLMMDIGNSEGESEVKIFLRKERQYRSLGNNWKVRVDSALIEKIQKRLGNENVKSVTISSNAH